MGMATKVGIGLLVIVLLVMAFGAWSWFNREPSITVADPGSGGERVMLGTQPANFYPAQGGGPHPAILLLGGSEGGLREWRNVYARQLAALGYSVLYPGYFATRKDNSAFNRVPMETFDTALAWLRARPDIAADRIGIIGHSKGAEAALMIASDDPQIVAVVAAMPSDVVWQGFDMSSMGKGTTSSSWTRDGKPLPFVRYKLPSWYAWFRPGALATMFRNSWDARGEYPDAAIPVERIAAPILLICGGKDGVWPSCPMAKSAEGRAREATLLDYPASGHWGFGPASGLDARDRKYLGTMGGTADAEMAARADQWPKVVAYLDAQLKP